MMMIQISMKQVRAAPKAARACARRLCGSTLAVVATAALGLFVFTSAPAALADPPIHQPLPTFGLTGGLTDPGTLHPAQPFNHACGTAVDSQGDVYVASAGNGVIDVFNPAREYLTSIPNANEPCGLAVDTKGQLYVLQTKPGEVKVVRYTPNAYPFFGTPTYGAAPTIIDSSGNAKGIAVDPIDGRLYVAKGNRVDTYGTSGTPGANEVQAVKIRDQGGTFTLSYEGSSPCAPIPTNATVAQIEGCLIEILGEGNFSVESVEGSFYNEFLVTFAGALGSRDVPSLVADTSAMEGFQELLIEENTKGFNGHIGEGELSEATGVASYTYAGGTSVPESDDFKHYLFVADAGGATDGVRVFSGADIRALKPRKTIEGVDQDGNPGTPDQAIGFGAGGAYLSADPANGHFFLYDDAHSVVDEFEPSGQYLTQIANSGFTDAKPSAVAVVPELDEVQHLRTNASGGTFTLSFEGAETAAIPYDASPAGVRAALEALPTISAGNAIVWELKGVSVPDRAYGISFVGELGNRDVFQLEANGAGLTGASATASVTTRVQGSGPGRIYVTVGAEAGAKALAFAPLPAPSRPPRPDLSFASTSACGVAIDSHGNRYVAVNGSIGVYDPAGALLTTINNTGKSCDIAVDSTGRVYALDTGSFISGDEKVLYFNPISFPPVMGAQYSGPTTCAGAGPPYFPSAEGWLTSIGVNPANDHVFVNKNSFTIELNDECEMVDSEFGSTVSIGARGDLAVYEANGNVYLVGNQRTLYILNPDGTEILARITGAGSPKGPFDHPIASIAVDQSNGHVVLFDSRGVAEEYEPSGAFVAEFGPFAEAGGSSGVAVDNGPFSPNKGSVDVAFFDHLTAFGPLFYGEPPIVKTGEASAVGGGKATLNGTVDPRGADLEDCQFEYLTEAKYKENLEAVTPVFEGALSEACIPGPVAIGKGTQPVPVHAELSGLDPEGRYRFQLVAENKYGSDADEGLFGPPILTTEPAHPIAYAEATLRARVDPSGLATGYRFEYGIGEGYGQSTPEAELAPGAGPTEIAVPIFGLAEGTIYHFRIVVENEAKTIEGPDQIFETRERLEKPPCPNDEYRTGRSANLPDCRAYELVTPADTRGASPSGERSQFNNWFVAPRGEAAGNRLSFFVEGTLPGFEGNGRFDGYRTARAEGAHPAEGWMTELVGPSYLEAGRGRPDELGVSSDQLYSLWQVSPLEEFPGTFPAGTYLHTPTGFEMLGQGSKGTDPDADANFLGAGGHAIFSSKAHLEQAAAPAETEAIYERTAGATTAKLVSLKPADSPFAAGENASYIASTEDGSAIVFEVGGTLYLRRGSKTIEVAKAPNTFAGISEDGSRLFYLDALDSDGLSPAPARLWSFDTETQSAIEIASDSRFVNVSADGSRVYFTSTQVLDDASKGGLGANNLYLWDEATETIRLIAQLDPRDLDELAFEHLQVNLIDWPAAVGPPDLVGSRRGSSPTRSTPDGGVLVFQSHGNLTPPYDAEGHSEVYRYEAASGKLTCVSCDPTGAAPVAGAFLQSFAFVLGGTTPPSTLIPNVTDDGQAVFFETRDPLLPEDANSVGDVYEWKAKGAGACKREGGCLALISSGQGENDSRLYAMTPDGHDVFFTTTEKLHNADITGSASIYDARVEGGIPDPPAAAPCQGDACQGQGNTPPALPSPASTGPGGGNEPKPIKPCVKGRHRVKGRCIPKHRKHEHRRRHAKHHRRTAR